MYHKNTLLPPDKVSFATFNDYGSLPELLLDKANHFGTLEEHYFAIDAVSHEKRFYSRFDKETRKIASALYKLGLRKGDIVIYMPRESIKLHIFLCGVWRANGVCRASYVEDDAVTLQHRIEESNCKLILCDRPEISKCQDASKGVPWHVEIILAETHAEFKSLQEFLEEDDGVACPKLDVGRDDDAIIFCTSGTTGASKGAVYTHGQLMCPIHMMSLLPLTHPKPNLMFTKATHIGGALLTLGVLLSGKTSIITGKMTPEIIVKAVDELKPGLVFAFPTYLLELVGPEAKDCDVSSIESILIGGTTITPAIKRALFQLPNLSDFMNTYGLTEGMVVTTAAFLGSKEGEPRAIRDLPDFSIGKICYPQTFVQIRDQETSLHVLGPHQLGELCVKSPGNFKEYYKNPEATEKAFIDGFFKTGDIGYYDEQGFVYVVDRLKEIFKYYNNHISPSELENVIAKHVSVRDVCVVGVPDPNGGGDIPRAFVVTSESPSQKLSAEIQKFSDGHFPSYKHLRGGVHFVSELPKGKTGKVARNLVAQLPLLLGN